MATPDNFKPHAPPPDKVRGSDTVQLTTDDPNMGFESPFGGRYRGGDGMTEVPRYLADQILRSDVPGVAVRKPLAAGFGPGTHAPVRELRERLGLDDA